MGVGGFWGNFWIVLFFGGLIAYAVTFILGLPVFLILWKRGWLGFWSTIISCGAIALLPIIVPYLMSGSISQKELKLFAYLFTTGCLVGIVFWVISIRKNTWIKESNP